MPSDLFEWPTTNMEGRLMHEPMYDEDSELRDLLRTLSPQASEFFREALMRGQADPDHESARLVRYRDVNGPAWADLVDRLALDPELRRRCVRLLGELRT